MKKKLLTLYALFSLPVALFAAAPASQSATATAAAPQPANTSNTTQAAQQATQLPIIVHGALTPPPAPTVATQPAPAPVPALTPAPQPKNFSNTVTI